MGIQIRYRKRKDGNFNVFLDVYQKGKRSCKYTDFSVSLDYSKPLKDSKGELKRDTKGNIQYPKVKEEDKLKMEAVRNLKLQHELDLGNKKFSFDSKSDEISITDFLQDVASRKKSKTVYLKVIPTLKLYLGDNFPIKNFNENKLRDYFHFLRTTYKAKSKKGKNLEESSIQSYFFGLNAVLNEAVRKKIIPVNPKIFLDRREIPSSCESKREHLSPTELKTLYNTPFEGKNKQVPDAFIFACLTGLRGSDLIKIKHSNVVDGVLQYRQKKSQKEFHYLPLNTQALAIIKQQDINPLDDCIFWKLPNQIQNCADQLGAWVKDAGINKHVTWHVGRHTFATILINAGVDIYTISKLLGHSSVDITERYSKVSDHSKIIAIKKLPNLYLEEPEIV